MEGQEKLDLIKWTSVVSILSVVLGGMFYTVWSGGAWRILHAPIERFAGVDPVAGTEFVLMAGTGWFLSLLLIMYNDQHKHYQASLLGLGAVLVVGVMNVMGFGGFLFRPSLPNLSGLFLGAGAAVLAVMRSGDLSKIDLDRSRFGKAVDLNGGLIKLHTTTRLIKYSTYSIVILGNIFNFYSLASNQALDENIMTVLMPVVFLAVSLGFIIAVERFVSLDIVAEDGQENSFELIGPRQSGKTYSTFALYRAVDNEEEFKFTFTNNKMGSLLDKNPEVTEEDAGFDAIGPNQLRDNNQYEFHFLKETGIPEKFQVRTRDYAGELLPDIADSLAEPMTDGGEEKEDEGDEEASDAGDPEETDGDTDGVNVDGVTIDSEETDGDTDGLNVDDVTIDSEETGSDTSGLDPEDMEQETDDLIKDVRDRVDPQGDSEGSGADPQKKDGHTPEDSQEADETPENPSESTEDRDTEEAQTEESGFGADPESSVSDPEDEDTSEDSATNVSESEESGFDERSGSTESDGTEVKSRNEIVKEVSKNVEESDKLVMILDTERFLNKMPNPSEYSMQTNEMRRIAESCNPDEIILMATKADYFIPQWQENENYESRPTTDNQERWKNFIDYVSDEFNENVAISAFMDEVNASRVYPVFFHTDGENDLTLDDDGNIRTEGYDRVLKALTR